MNTPCCAFILILWDNLIVILRFQSKAKFIIDLELFRSFLFSLPSAKRLKTNQTIIIYTNKYIGKNVNKLYIGVRFYHTNRRVMFVPKLLSYLGVV